MNKFRGQRSELEDGLTEFEDEIRIQGRKNGTLG